MYSDSELKLKVQFQNFTWANGDGEINEKDNFTVFG